MKNLRKRSFSLFLAIIMIATMIPISAQAAAQVKPLTENDWTSEGYYVPNDLQGYTYDYGLTMTGGDLAFAYFYKQVYNPDIGGMTRERVLVISKDPQSSGSQYTIPDYTAATNAPWGQDNAANKLYIQEGITGIGAYAFASMTTLNGVTFGDASDLTYVGKRAFYGDSRAVFTDETSAGALDLSHVSRMGEYAFASCTRLTGVSLNGDMTAVESGEDADIETAHKIPKAAFSGCGGLTSVSFSGTGLEVIGQSAFSSTGLTSVSLPEGVETIEASAFSGCTQLTSVTVPDGVTEIGQSAFSGLTKMSSLTLPDSLVTIGERAFYCGTDNPNTLLSSLTIPEHVETIGEEAFCNFKGLREVVVESEVLETVDAAAFGNGTHNAYNTTQDGKLVGAEFKTPSTEIAGKFINEYNCYMGVISPLTLDKEKSYPATCERDGLNVYQYKFNGEEKTLEETLTRLQPHYIGSVTVSASCTTEAYYEKTCDNYFVKNERTGEWERTEHVHIVAIQSGEEGYDEPDGHAYAVTDISNEGKIDSTGAVVTFTCENSLHSESRDKAQKVVTITLKAATLKGNTLNTLADIRLPSVSGGTLTWNDTNTKLTYSAGVQYFPVTFTPNNVSYSYLQKDGQLITASQCGSIQLQVGVQVDKVALDFSDIAYENASNLVKPGSDDVVPVAVKYYPNTTASITEYRYYNGSDYDNATPPALESIWEGMVAVTFTYDPDLYTVDPNTQFDNSTADAPYTITGLDNEAGTVTISHRYQIVAGTWDAVVAQPIGRTYGDADKNTVHLSGVPADSAVTIQWQYKPKDAADGDYSSPVTIQMPEDQGNSIDIAPIVDAGDYTVKVTITYASYEPTEWERTVDVHVSKKGIALPTAASDLAYTGEELTGVTVADGMDGYYTLTGNTAVESGPHTATATISDEHFPNYCWAGQAETEQEASISWEIARRQVAVPLMKTVRQYEYTGAFQEIITKPTTMFEYTYPADSTTLEGKLPGSEIVAFTVTYGRAKDAGNYPVKAVLSNDNYYWVGAGAPADGALELTLGAWEITPVYLTAPALTVTSKVYDGEPYDASVLVTRNEAAMQAIQDAIKPGDSFTFSHYRYTGTGSETIAPTNAGSYTIQAVYTYPQKNYSLQGNTAAVLTISQKSVTLGFAEPSVTAAYTADGTALQLATVDGLVAADQLKDPATLYTISYSYQYKATAEEEFGEAISISDPTNYTFKNVGIYQITAKLGAGTQSNNYTAADASYTLTIGKSSQTITLTPESGTDWDTDHNTPGTYQITKTLGDAPFAVTGTAALDSGNVTITYEATEEKDTASAEANVVTVENNGTVTLLRAGTATVTVKAAQTANVGEASVSYKLVINKADPDLTLTEQSFGYTGSAITGYKNAQVTNADNSAAPVDTSKITYAFFQDDNGKPGDPMGDAPSQVGTYWLTASLTGDPNYADDTVTAKVTITAQDLMVDITGYTGTYDGGSHDAATITSVTGTGTISSYKAYFAVTSTDTAPDAPSSEWKDSLQVQVQDVADSSGSAMYYWYKVEVDNHNPAIGSFTVKISPKELTVSDVPGAFVKEYSGNSTVTTDLRGIAVASGIDSEPITVSDTSGSYADEDVGENKQVTLTLTLEGAAQWGNYSYEGAQLTEGKLILTKATGKITPKPITVTGGITATPRVYDGTTSVKLTGTTLASSGVLNADKNDVQLTLKADAAGTLADADAGEDKQVTIDTDQIQLDGAKAGNYDVTAVTPVTVNIRKATVTLKAPTEATASYTGQPLDTKYYQVTASGLTGKDGVEFNAADDITYTFQKDGEAAATTTVPSDQGTYTVTATLAATATDKYKNYDVQQVTFTVTISASALTETPKDYSALYDGKDHDLEDLITSVTGVGGSPVGYTVVFVKSDAKPSDWASAVTSVKDAADSGTYWYKISADNYTDKTGSVKVDISRLALTVTPTLSPNTKVYDGTPDFPTAKITSTDVTGEAADETITATADSAAYNRKDVADADTITIQYTLSGDDLANYTYEGTQLGNGTDTVSVTVSGTITAKPVTVTVPNQTMTYNGTATYTVGADGIDCGEVSGTVTGESLTASIGVGKTGTADSKDAGTTTVTFDAGHVTLTAGAATDARNYQVSGPVTADLTISPKTITLNFTNAQSDTITTPYTGSEVGSGVYAAKIEGMESGDNSPAATDIVYAFYTNEACTDSFSGTPSNVGTYWVKAVVNENSAVNGNYTSAQATAKLVITTDAQVSLTVESNAYSGTYDGLPHNASGGMVVKVGGATLTDGDYTIYYTTAKPDDGNELNPSAYGSSTTMPSYTDAGSYTVYYLVDAKNYNDVAGSFTVGISRAELTLSRNVTTAKTYDSTTDAASQVTNVELTGQQNREKISAALASAVYNEASADGASKITITYTLIAKDGAKLENYTIKIADAGAVEAAASMTETVSASITPAPVNVTIQNQTAVYDGAKPEVTQTLWNTSDTVYPGDDLGITLSIPTNAKDVGTYDISGAASNPNYAVTFVKGQFEVTRRPVTIAIGDARGVYGDAPDLSGVTLTDATASPPDAGMVSGESTEQFRGLLSTNADGKSSVGKYDITGTAGEYGNYDVTFTKGTYTVNRRPVTVTIADKGSLYGQDIAGLTWSVTGGSMANGEDLGITLETTAVKGSDAGTYAISEQSRNTAVAANYEVTVQGETAFGSSADQATYTIGKANLSAAFDSKVLYPNFGRPVTNPVTFSNASVNPYAEVVDQGDLDDIAAAARYTSSNPSAVSVDETTGAVTLISANASAIISLTVGETQNFNAITVAVTYTINVGSAGGYQPNFTPGNLTYNGQPQQLMTLNGTLPAGLSIQYSTDNTSWKGDLTQITGTQAGNYTVYWEITDSSGNYGDSNGTVFVTIAKDILEDEEGFTFPSPSIVFSQYQGKIYENPLKLPSDYAGKITFQGSNDTVATVDADGKVTVRQNGTVTITATCYTDDNYQGRQYSYTLTVASSQIDYAAPVALNGTYNGGEQDSLTTPVTSTTAGAVIRYGVNTNGLSFPEEDIPKIKDAGTYEIWYQVTAPGGYATVVGHVTAVIHPKDITEGMISGISDSYTYSGNKITPIPTVTDQELSQRLTANVDYTLSYGENTQVGTGTVTIAGTGNYGGSIQRTFKIEAVGGEEITASLSEYFGSLDQHPAGTSTQVSVTHGNHDVGFAITGVTPTAQVDADGKTISFTTPGVYTITVKAGDTLHAEQEFTLTYMLMPKTSDGGFAMTFDGNDTRVVTYGQRLIPDGQTAIDLLEVKAGDGTVLTYGTDYTLSCMYYDCLGNSGQTVTTVQGIPAAGMYVVTAAGTGQYGSDQTGVFTLLVLQKNIGGEDITWTVADDALVYNAAAQEPSVTGGTFTDEAGVTQSVDFAPDSFQNNINAGSDTARAIVKVPAGSNNYTGTASIPFSIGRRPITDDTGKFTITVPASVSISVGGEARPAVTIRDEELGRELTSQDFTVTYANNTSAGTATASITGTGNYYTGTDIQRTFSVVVTSTTFSMEITPVTQWAYGETGATDITITDNSGITLAVGTDYTLSISKDGGAEQRFTNTADALAYLNQPGTYIVKAIGIGGYSFTETQTVTIEKAKLDLEILVTPNVKAGAGTAKIQVTPGGTWPAGMDGTQFTKLTVVKDGTAQKDLELEYNSASGTYQEITFSFSNETAAYAFGVDASEITGFDPVCYELEITGGTLNVVQQSAGGGGGGGAVTYTITASAGAHGSINPAGKVSVVKGQDAAFVFTADSGWQVADVLVDGVSAGAVSSYTFVNVSTNHTISVTFEEGTGIADPEDTGVSDWLITGDHILYLNGYGQDLFGPTDNLTRAQAAQLFYNLLLDKNVPVNVSFDDVPADAWYAEAVHTLASLGIVEGVGSGLFDPERPITRAEFTVIAMRFARPKVIDTDIFPDVSRNDWFYEQVVSAVQYGWITGYADGTFRPQNTITRAEVAAITNRMLGRIADQAFVDANAGALTQFTDVSPYYWAYYDIMEAANAHSHATEGGKERWISLLEAHS